MELYDFLKVDSQSSKPIYLQLIEGFERFSRANELGTPLPPERKMALDLGVSRNSLRQAVSESCSRGFLVQRWGKGVFTAAKNTRKRILVMMPDNTEMSMPWNYILPGTLERAKELSIEVEQISTTFLRSQTPEQITAFLEQESFTGILHMDYMSWDMAEELVALRQFQCPILCPHVDEEWSQMEPFPMIRVDERLAFRQTVEALVQEGHRNIVSVMPFSNPYSHGIRGYGREEYLRMLEEAGANPDQKFLLDVKHDPGIVRERVRDFLLHKHPSFTAFVCFSDFYAIMVINALKEFHLKVPDDVSVMGFCGYPGGKFLDPPLSTTDFHYHEIGRMAVDRLLTIPAEWRTIPEKDRVTLSPHTVILRESVGKIRSERLPKLSQPSRQNPLEMSSIQKNFIDMRIRNRRVKEWR